jgi:DNA polymerase-3 subunit delta
MAAQESSPGSAFCYVLHGDDEFTRSEQLASLRERMSGLLAGDFNVTQLEVPPATVDEVLAACHAVPFLGERRLVIVRHLLEHLTARAPRRSGTRKAKAQVAPEEDSLGAFLAAIQHIPLTTALVLEEGRLDEVLVERFAGPRWVVRRFERPRGERLVSWVVQRARAHGAELEAAAARALAAESEDLRRLDAELSKLALYTRAPITVADVEALVAGGELSIFALLDAVAERRRGDALAALENLLEYGQRPEAIVGQLASLLRRLLVVKELARAGAPTSAQAGAYGINPNALPKLVRQARELSMERLEWSLRRLLDADRASKSGATEPELALELAVADLAGKA